MTHIHAQPLQVMASREETAVMPFITVIQKTMLSLMHEQRILATSICIIMTTCEDVAHLAEQAPRNGKYQPILCNSIDTMTRWC